MLVFFFCCCLKVKNHVSESFNASNTHQEVLSYHVTSKVSCKSCLFDVLQSI